MNRAALLLLALPLIAGACRILTGEVACTRDRDCPEDAGISFCDAPETDGGVGTCVEVDPTPDEDGGSGFNLDAGFLTPPTTDAGPDAGGGLPGFP